MDNEIISWFDAAGIEHILTDQDNIAITIGTSGRYMPPIEFVEDESPFQAGSNLRLVKVKAREMDFPIEINGLTQMDIRNKLRELLRIFNPLKGEGKIKVINPDGSQREITCRYRSGLEISESRQVWEKFVLVLKAFDPYWYDRSTIVQTFKLNESPGLFFPILPLRLVSSTVFADITIDNIGDVETYPEWIIQGPGEGIKITNLTTGEVIFFDHPGAVLEAGETITINTSPIPPNEKTVTKSDGTNVFYWISDDSSLWALQDGSNAIQIQMANATSDSSIQLTYRNRYWGP